MNNFNIKRFNKLMVWTIFSSKKELFAQMATLFIIYFTIQMLPAITDDTDTTSFKFKINSFSNIAFMVFVFYAWISGSFLFTNMKTKEKRIAYKMLPATDLEKWIARVVYILATCIVGSFLMLVLTDLLRMGIFQLFYGDYFMSNTAEIWNNQHIFMPEDASATSRFLQSTTVYIWMAWVYSIYILGGTLFRRQAFIMTSLTMFVLTCLFVAFLSLVKDYVSFSCNLNSQEEHLALAFLSLFGLILVVVNYWLSYKIFRHTQVINNRWINAL